MLWTVAMVLLVLWMLGMGTSYTGGGLVHLLLVIAAVVVVFQFVGGRRRVGRAAMRCAADGSRSTLFGAWRDPGDKTTTSRRRVDSVKPVWRRIGQCGTALRRLRQQS